jgi:hypothetical protein
MQYSFPKIVVETILFMAKRMSKSEKHYLDVLCIIVTTKYKEVCEIPNHNAE